MFLPSPNKFGIDAHDKESIPRNIYKINRLEIYPKKQSFRNMQKNTNRSEIYTKKINLFEIYIKKQSPEIYGKKSVSLKYI